VSRILFRPILGLHFRRLNPHEPTDCRERLPIVNGERATILSVSPTQSHSLMFSAIKYNNRLLRHAGSTQNTCTKTLKKTKSTKY